jgi:hypothetical protein
MPLKGLAKIDGLPFVNVFLVAGFCCFMATSGNSGYNEKSVKMLLNPGCFLTGFEGFSKG